MKRARAATLWACMFPVTSAMAQSIVSTTQPAAPLMSLSMFSQLRISVNAMDAGPINGFTPQVVVGLTNEQNHSDTVIGYGTKSSFPGGSKLPVGLPPKYIVATLDSGSQADILTYADTQAYNFAAAGREGTKFQTIQGANGDEDLPITDSIGVYMTDFGNATVSGSTIGVSPNNLAGHWNVPVLTANPEDQLPNDIGSPILSQYRVTIQNTQPQHLTVGSTTFRTPKTSLSDFSTSLPAGYSKLTLKTTDAGPPDQPYYINYDFTGADNPDTPGAWTSLVTNGGVALSHNGSSTSNQTFLLDTGAQLSLISNDTAASVGIFNASPANADFTVDVLGVGGIQTVPGYYLSTLSLTTQGGIISWNRIPVLVFDVADPRDPSSALPGLLGTNLFGDRDLILNTNVDATGQIYLGIGPQWQWNNSSGGTWGNSTNWTLALPNGIDTQANFYGAITSPKTITVDSGGFTVGTMNFDNPNRYTINGPGRITLSVSVDQAQINVSTGSHTINAPITLVNDTIMNVSLPSSRLTITSDVTATGMTIFKQGPGVLEMKNVRSQGLTLNDGTVLITANGGTNGTSRVSSFVIDTTLAASAHLDLTNNAMIVDYTGPSPLPTIRQYLANGYNGGAWNGGNGIESSLANSTTFAIASAEKSTLGLTSFAGQSLSGPAVLIKYDYYGDANFDGHVDVADLAVIALHYNTTGDVWTSGDFNYDGVVDVNDLQLFAQNWLAGAGNPLAGPALGPLLVALGLPEVDVPEPEGLTWMLGLSLLVFGGSRLRARVRRV